MIKNLLLAFLASCTIFACGGETNGFDDEGADVGQTAEELKAPSSPSFGYGVTTGPSHLPCKTNDAGQACLIPTYKTLAWCILPDSGGLTANETTDAIAAMNAVTSGTSWLATHRPDGAACAADNTVNVRINNFSNGCGSVCNTSSSIDGCVCENLTVGSPLSESLPGTYSAMEGGIIHVDRNAIAAGFGLTGQPPRDVFKHGIAHAAAAIMGIGNRTNFSCSGSSPFSSRCTTPTTFSTHNFHSAGELCKLQSFALSFPTTFAYSGTCPSD